MKGTDTQTITGQSIVDRYNAGEQNFQMFLNDAVLYVNPYMVVTPKGYTKHYYNGSQRIAARIGKLEDLPNDIIDTSAVAMERIANARAYMEAILNISEIQPIDTTSVFADIERDALDELQWQCNDEEWTLNATVHCDSNLLQPILTKDSTRPDRRVSGIYYYHPDHLGSATWITNSSGVPVQFIHYMPWGELWYNQQASAYNERFKFTGKERDTETGYDYFGARYYSSALPMWLSVDPLSDDYPNITPYAYCNWNPVTRIDPDGMADYYTEDGTFIANDNVNDNKVYQQDETGEHQFLCGVLANPNFAYKGNVQNVKLSFTGQMMQDNHKAKGKLSLIQIGETFEFERANYNAVSGSTKLDCLPNGNYRTNNLRVRTDNQSFIKERIGFSIDLIPNFLTNRTALRIHPDGTAPGTAGCIGLNGTQQELSSFYNLLKPLYNKQGMIPLVVNINNNPNYHH